MKHILSLAMFLCSALLSFGQQNKPKVVVFELKSEINSTSTRITSQAVSEAEKLNADLIIVHMNTYGGYVTDADSVRSRLLNTKIPTCVFIDNNAASAGALISIACDAIYMRKGASIGASTVVIETGEKAPDKYQSYMRKQIRSTAESKGKILKVSDNDSTFIYKRNPDIAEGMVDERMIVPGLVDSTKVITLSTEEALKWGYCEGIVASISEILTLKGLENAEVITVKPTALDKVLEILSFPWLRMILILLIIGGIVLELQAPGLGVPIVVSIAAAIAFFAPLYLDGFAENWEILVFISGLVLLALEIFIIPGFGVAGISGVIFLVSGLTLSMIRNVNLDFGDVSPTEINNAIATVLFSVVGFGVLLYFFGSRFIKSSLFQKAVLISTIAKAPGIQHSNIDLNTLLGQEGTAHTALRPMGRVKLNGVTFEAKTDGEFVDSGKIIRVKRIENQYLVVKTL